MYHGTRLSMSDGSSLAGINPRKSNIEFLAAEAFYVTNIVTATFEFPLHNWLARNPKDTVGVFCFELDLKILHGDVACPSNEKFKIRWFEEDVNDELWADFCIAHLYSREAEQHFYNAMLE